MMEVMGGCPAFSSPVMAEELWMKMCLDLPVGFYSVLVVGSGR